MRVQPPLRYHGAKWTIADWISSHFPAHRAYVEPFAGSAAVLLTKPRSHFELYNDANGDVVNLFRVLRSDDAERLVDALVLTPFARSEYDDADKWDPDPVERARRLVVRSYFAHGSTGATGAARPGFRAKDHTSNSTVARVWARYPERLVAVAERLRGVVVENRDAFEIITQHDSDSTLFYCDPPYTHDERTTPTAYGDHEFTVSDHERLSETLSQIDGHAIVSGYRSPLYDSLYGSWQPVDRQVRADGVGTRTESLWVSPGAEMQLVFDWGK